MTSPHVLAPFGYGCAALIAAELYLLPLVVGWARRVPGLRVIAVIDLVLGWTVIGWIVAIALALRPVRAGTATGARDRAGQRPARTEPAARRGDGARQPAAAPPLVLPGSPRDPRLSE